MRPVVYTNGSVLVAIDNNLFYSVDIMVDFFRGRVIEEVYRLSKIDYLIRQNVRLRGFTYQLLLLQPPV